MRRVIPAACRGASLATCNRSILDSCASSLIPVHRRWCPSRGRDTDDMCDRAVVGRVSALFCQQSAQPALCTFLARIPQSATHTPPLIPTASASAAAPSCMHERADGRDAPPVAAMPDAPVDWVVMSVRRTRESDEGQHRCIASEGGRKAGRTLCDLEDPACRERRRWCRWRARRPGEDLIARSIDRCNWGQ